MIENLNIKLFYLLNNLSHFSTATDQTIIFLAIYFPYFLLLVISIWIIFFQKTFSLKLKTTIQCLVAGVLGIGVVIQTIRLFFYQLRPAYSINGVYPLFEEVSFSFPSAHSTFYFSISYIVYVHNKSLGLFFFASSVIISVARIMAGVHFPIDVVAGAVIGLLTGLFVHFLMEKLYPSKS